MEAVDVNILNIELKEEVKNIAGDKSVKLERMALIANIGVSMAQA